MASYGLTIESGVTITSGITLPSFETDDYFEYTTLLLPGNGTNTAQNNTFLDGSTNNFPITRNGNTTQGTFSPFSQTGWGNYFGGDGNYLSSAYNADFSFSTGEFSIECWANVSDAGRSADANKYGTFVSAGLTGSASGLWDFTFRIVGGVITEVTFGNNGGAVLTVTSQTITLNQWHHFVVCRSGSTFSFFVDGTRIGTTTYSTAVDMNASGSLRIAALAFLGTYQNWVNGYISNLRIIKGSSAYNAASSSITVPTIPLTSPTNTKLLTCQSNRFVDSNTQVAAKTITLTGTPTVVAFSPFNPTASWSAATYGGSGYFDGNGDYLNAGNQTALHLGAGDFTVEMWLWKNANTTYMTACGDFQFATTNTFQILSDLGGTKIGWYNGANNAFTITSSAEILINTWTHIAFVRSGSALTLYINGVSDSTATLTTNFNASTSFYIGHTPELSAGRYWNGYISNLRVVKGTAVYTGAFTPPTAPITDAGSTSATSYPSTANVNTSFASSATSLLLNFTNAGIYDATSKNDLETVGNAQISTTQSKFGGSSMYFDGSGDILSSPGSQNYVFNGDFTVEGWVYIDSTMASSRPDNLKTFIFVGWNTGNTPQLYVYGTTSTAGIGLGYYDGTSGWEVAATVPKDQWAHIAYARTGSALYGFVNGTRYTINASISATIGSANTFVVGGNPNQVGAYYSYLKGNINDLRITKGYARYTANFTAPTAAFPTF